MKLLSSQYYKNTPDYALCYIIGNGGCGPGNGIGDIAVPDTIYGLNVKEACKRHDFDYAIGGTEEDKIISDIRLLSNLVIIIENNSRSRILKTLRRHRAIKYYLAVSDFGGSSFTWEE